MSTRRARIKAVAALPPRRKNIENTDGKGKQKDNLEKVLKSPRTPRNHLSKNEEKNSPVRNVRTPPALLPINSVSKTQDPDKIPTPTAAATPKVINKALSTPRSEKIAVIASTPGVLSVGSPLAKNSLDKRRPATPLVPPSPRPVSMVCVTRSGSQTRDNKIPTPTFVAQSNAGSSSIQSTEKSVSTPSKEKQSDVPDDYSVPSVPESITDETVMDGIVPLQTASNAPKPIDLLKNEIISECAEVAFDPIVPLPSPSKVRPKLRPVPRLAPHRRNSVQGSASESEDESRRALLAGAAPSRQRHDSHASHSATHLAPNKDINRIRNDSVSSGVSQALTQPPPATSPVKEKHYSSKSRRNEASRRSFINSCRTRKEEIKRDALTMYDLIFYNPTTNPIVPDEDEVSAKEANAKEAERQAKSRDSEDETADPPPPAAVPQIKLGPNGEIVLDEQSLVIKQSASRKVSSVVREGSWAGSGGGKYTRSARTAEWSAPETVRFYRALAAVGTDFTLMAPLFPDRKRKDLYLKFKKEERLNGAQVDKALRTATAWDPEHLLNEFKKEREEAARQAEEERLKLQKKKEDERERMKAFKDLRIRCSRGSKALEAKADRGANQKDLTADEFIERAMEERRQARKKKKQQEFVHPNPKPAKKPKPIPFASLTLNTETVPKVAPQTSDLATLTRIPKPVNMDEVSGVPSNIEIGSLVVLRVNDPKSPSKTMLQTYIAQGGGKLTPVSLPPTFLNSVVGYMKKGTPKSTISAGSSPQVPSPSGERPSTPGVIQLNPSPNKRQRHSSYTITPL